MIKKFEIVIIKMNISHNSNLNNAYYYYYYNPEVDAYRV